MTFIAASLPEIKGIALLEVGRKAAVCTESERNSRGVALKNVVLDAW